MRSQNALAPQPQGLQRSVHRTTLEPNTAPMKRKTSVCKLDTVAVPARVLIGDSEFQETRASDTITQLQTTSAQKARDPLQRCAPADHVVSVDLYWLLRIGSELESDGVYSTGKRRPDRVRSLRCGRRWSLTSGFRLYGSASETDHELDALVLLDRYRRGEREVTGGSHKKTMLSCRQRFDLIWRSNRYERVVEEDLDVLARIDLQNQSRTSLRPWRLRYAMEDRAQLLDELTRAPAQCQND